MAMQRDAKLKKLKEKYPNLALSNLHDI